MGIGRRRNGKRFARGFGSCRGGGRLSSKPAALRPFPVTYAFFQDQIRALLVTDSCQGMAMGFEYMQETLPFENALKRLHSVFQSEIMVVGISSQMEGARGDLEADICVVPYSPGFISPNIQAQVFLKHDLEDIRSLYRTLMNYLEDS